MNLGNREEEARKKFFAQTGKTPEQEANDSGKVVALGFMMVFVVTLAAIVATVW